MSINSLSNAALARRADFEPANAVPRNLSEIATAAGNTPQAVAPAGAQAAQPEDGTNTALATLTTYIPTEVLTLYVSAIATLGSLKNAQGQDIGRWIPFVCFLVVTPAVVWLAFASKVQAAGKPLPWSPRGWPVWEMFAATVAYFAWAFALPNTPFAQFADWYSTGLAGFLVLIVSWGLGAFSPLMQRELSS
jgi:hypothetical protein